MKFPVFKEADSGISNIAGVVSYLTVEMATNLKELFNGLTKLNFSDNFESFTVSMTIPGSTELPIRNMLRNGQLPVGRLIIRGDAQSKDVVDGDTAWNQDFVFLKNTNASPSNLTVVFFR